LSLPYPPSPPLERKKLELWKIVVVGVVVAIIILGVVAGTLLIGQSTYSRVKVLSDGLQQVTVGENKLLITYKWMGEGAWSGNDYVASPIRVQLVNSGVDRILQPTQGAKYSIAGIEIVVSEVHDDYVILLLK
jgi:hypothetical protein